MQFIVSKLSLSAGLFLAASLLVGTAQAEVKPYPSCERDPTESDISAAKGAYEAGQVSFQEADYDRALLYWEDAFRRDCTAVKLLLNIARAYELSGAPESAVNALQTYVDRRPDAKDRDSVEKRIAKLREKVDAEAAVAPPPPTVDAPDAEEQGDEEEATVSVGGPPVAQPEAKKPTWPIWLTGGGIVVALVGHGLINQGETLRNDKADELGCNLDAGECPNDAARDETNAAGRDERQSGIGIATLGHVAGITGGALWWILWTKDSTSSSSAAATAPKTALTPVVAPGFQGLSWSGRF